MTRPPLTRLGVAAVAVGGAVGALLRWLAGGLGDAGPSFPWTTLTVNVVGCFALALLPAVAVVRRTPWLAQGLGPGLLGGFTTLSIHTDEARALVASGQAAVAAGYLALTLGACLAAVMVADHWSTRSERAVFDAEEGNE
ncbi:fluoride efflux transporter FluC [Nocardioides limicola]|uniref:fluoride efflux transporter FluC n=1 Tax=Nocardioides limicola TaxID=2803368 RepID=UPI00193B8756|nr:CrcB family protein [Nocardioides sp. DJM-14]